MKRAGLVYGYGQLKNGDLDNQTRARCEKALRLYKSRRITKIYITVGAHKNWVLMGQKMREYFLASGVTQCDAIFSPLGHNTAGETDGCLLLIVKKEKIIAISSWYHLPRIWFLWLVRGRWVHLAGSCEGVKATDLFWEPLKIANSILRPISSSKINAP